MTLSGLDASNLQGTISWPAVAKSGIAWAAVKASEGVKFSDPYLAANLAGMRANGILVAVYHFALPAWNAPADEAAHFIQTFKPLSQAYDVIVLDLEADPYGGTLPADVGPWAQQWLTIVEAEFGCVPVLYTNLDLIQNRGAAVLAATGCGLWLAAPDVANPPVPAPWPFLMAQQTSWTGTIPGIGGAVDLDSYFGDAASFKRYGIPADVPKPPLPTNDDNVQMIRLVLQPDLAGLISYAQRFA